MPRTARKQSPTSIYHLMVRGINRDRIFEADEDKDHYLKILKEAKTKSDFELYSYILMDNHLHLLVRENTDSIGTIMKRIGIRYASWYNKRHERVGHLFQDRFKSEAIEDDKQFLTVLRYILQNPVKAGICKKPADYPWGSYQDYITGAGITDTAVVLEMLSISKSRRIKEFAEFCELETNEQCLDIAEQPAYYSDNVLLSLIDKEFRLYGKGTEHCQGKEIEEIIRFLRKQHGVSLRQIARITGQKLGRVFKIAANDGSL